MKQYYISAFPRVARKALFTASLFISAFSVAQAQPEEPAKVLILGNSFCGFNNMPEIFRNMAAAAGESLIMEAHTPGGVFVNASHHGEEDHAKNPYVFNLIRTTPWDYVVVQDNQGYFCGTTIGAFSTSSGVVAGHIKLRDSLLARNECGRLMLFSGWVGSDPMGWAPELGMADPEAAHNRVFEQYQALNNDHLDQVIAPIGMAFNYVLEHMPEVNLFSPDETHSSYEGSYVTAAVIFSTVFRKSPEPFEYPGMLDPVVARQLRKYAYMAVQNYSDLTRLDSIAPKLTLEGSILRAPLGYIDYIWYCNGERTMPSGDPTTCLAMRDSCYQLEVRDVNGCQWTSLEYCMTDEPSSLNNIPKNAGISLTPNPATDRVTLNVTDPLLLQQAGLITDPGGRVLQQFRLTQMKQELSIGHLAPGLYFVKLANGYTYKVVKQ